MNRVTHDWPAYILAGGRSRRFGADKARAELSGRPLIQRLADQLAPHVREVTVVADRAGKYADLELRTIGDAQPHLGPVGGLSTALEDMAARGDRGWCWLVACDLAEVPASWLAALAAHARVDGTAIACRDERWQPMPGLYHASIHAQAAQYLQGGGRAMWRLLDQLHAVAVTPPTDAPLVHINTPEDYERARERDARGSA